MARSRGIFGNLASAPLGAQAQSPIDMSRLNAAIAARGGQTGQGAQQGQYVPQAIPQKNEIQALLDQMKNKTMASMGLGAPQEDTSVAAEDIDGVSGVLSKAKTALKEFSGYEVRTTRTNVNYNGKDVPGYEIRIVMRMVSEQGKRMSPAAEQKPASPTINDALKQLQSMSPEQIKGLAAQAQAVLNGTPIPAQATPQPPSPAPAGAAIKPNE